jgi:hypothetical protein
VISFRNTLPESATVQQPQFWVHIINACLA